MIRIQSIDILPISLTVIDETDRINLKSARTGQFTTGHSGFSIPVLTS